MFLESDIVILSDDIKIKDIISSIDVSNLCNYSWSKKEWTDVC